MFNVPTKYPAPGKPGHTEGSWDWRCGIGLLLLALAGILILFGVGAVFGGLARDDSFRSPIWLLTGPPEILCLIAAAILGKEKHQKLARKVRTVTWRSCSDSQTSRIRYYLGLAGCLFNGVPLILYAYVPEFMPGGSTKMSILVIADLVFFWSLFVAGGEFWEKLRRLFVWDGHSDDARSGRSPSRSS